MKATDKTKTLSEIHFYNDLVKGDFLKIGNKLYSVYCVANNKIDAYNNEWIFILTDILGKKVFFESDTKAELFPIR